MARDPFHFVGRMVIPLLLIVAAAYSGFFHRDASAIDRVLLAMSALIAAVAFNFVIASSLPHISYLTWLDGFVILAYVAIFSTLVLHTIAGALEHRSLTAAKVRVDQWSQILFPVVYLLMVLLLFL